MPFDPIENQQHDIRLTLTMPNCGRVIIEGNQKTVSKFWGEVKVEFADRITDALKNHLSVKGDIEPVKLEVENQRSDKRR